MEIPPEPARIPPALKILAACLVLVLAASSSIAAARGGRVGGHGAAQASSARAPAAAAPGVPSGAGAPGAFAPRGSLHGSRIGAGRQFHRHHSHVHRAGPSTHLFFGASALVVSPLRYYGYAPMYLAPAPAAAEYIERDPPARSPSDYWYYCAASEAYYPYVTECAGGWQAVEPVPPPA